MRYDNEWVQNTEAANKNVRQTLQGRLSAAQSHLHKEAIRTAYIALAQQDAKTGELRDALGLLLRATDYCTTRTQTAHISLQILELALNLQNFLQVREYVTKVEHTLGATTTSASPTTAAAAAGGGGSSGSSSSSANAAQLVVAEVATKLKIASGLERLAQGEYAKAAQIFTALITSTPSTSWEWPTVSCPEDLCTYAGLLSLATQDRTCIVQLAEHPEALELVPAMREILKEFGRANYYQVCRATIGDGTNCSILPFPDLYLSGGNHWATLTKLIQEKCLMEYLKPYESVQLDTMAQHFPFDDLQDILVDLIGRGLIPGARLDCQSNILHKNSGVGSSSSSSSVLQPTSSIQSSLAKLERRVLDDSYALLIRLACLEHDLCVVDTHPRGTGRRGGGAAGAAGVAVRYDDDDDDDLGRSSSDEEGDAPMLDISEQPNPEDLY